MDAKPAAEPSPLLAKLTQPSATYKRRAWLAMAGLALFMLLYFALAGQFLYTAWRLTFGAESGGANSFLGWLVGGAALFLAVFMLKGLFFVQHGGTGDATELRPEDQPELFRFLHHLADKAGAPRPHKVFVSSRVNAAVFYDLSILNLLFPSKKNLEIGLGLVNSLTLGEFRAVLAHEFGHFAQRAMAVGRWVYVAQQIAGNLVARRDKLDDFLRGLSSTDFRIAWVGWLLSVVVWAIRSLVDSAFQLVVLMQRALSREMEMNADLVAVSVTGSDALVHALHRLQSADDAWNRAVHFVLGQKDQGRSTADLFAIQTLMVTHMGQLYNDARYGQVPLAEGLNPQARRLFKAELAQPPQMWLTHPLNHEREANAKRHYVHAEIDGRSAWHVFANAQALREQVTATLIGENPPPRVSLEDSTQELARQFSAEFLRSAYRGVYFGRSAVRHTADVSALCEPPSRLPTPTPSDFDRLYPATLADDMERRRALQTELEQLLALQRGDLTPPGGVIQHRGRTLKRSQLSQAVGQVERERTEVNDRLKAHDLRCRSLHRAAAASLGQGWDSYLKGLLEVIHYADHVEAELRDLQGVVANQVHVQTAARRVSDEGRRLIVNAANEVHLMLKHIFGQAAEMHLDPSLRARFNDKPWSEVLGELGLPVANASNIGDWIKVADGWINQAGEPLAALRSEALELLLRSESRVAAQLRGGADAPPLEAAPEASRVPASYPTLLVGAERPRQAKLGWWARFQIADGAVPAGARLVVAGGIVAAVLGLGGSVGNVDITVYNALARPVMVTLGEAAPVRVGPLQSHSVSLAPAPKLAVATHTAEGALIERFEADARGSFGKYVYNVAGAAPLVEWTQIYGNGTARPERLLGAPRFTTTSAGTLFAEPPQSISSKTGGGTREVLTAIAGGPNGTLGALTDNAEQRRMVLAHARWDALDTDHVGEWLAVAANAGDDMHDLLKQRLAEAPDNVLLRRLEQDVARDDGRAAVCERHLKLAAAQPANVDWLYLRLRCTPDSPEHDLAFIEAHARHPEHPWLAFAAAYAQASHAQWPQAVAAYDVARRHARALGEPVGIELARIQRLLRQDTAASLKALSERSNELKLELAIESGDVQRPDLLAYSHLAAGRFDVAAREAHKTGASEPRFLRLAAASEGASAELLAKARALPASEGWDSSSVWVGYAAAARDRLDLQGIPLDQSAEQPRHVDTMRRFIQAVAAGTPPNEAERLLDGLLPRLRGQAYSAGVVVLGRKAPAAWRDNAKRLLFAYERPYFG